MSPRLSRVEEVKLIRDSFGPQDRILMPIVADPDAIASAMAFRRLLWRRVAGVTIARVNEIKRPDNLTLIRLVRVKLSPIEEVDLSQFNRFALVDGQPDHHESLAKFDYEVIIDHHPPSPTTEAAGLVDIRPNYGATATIMTQLLRAAGIKPARTLATALFYAIKTDTDSFTRPTVEEDMQAFRYLYQYVDHNVIRKIESSEIPLALLKFYRQAMANLNIRKDTGFTYLDRVTNPDVLVMIADFLMHIQTLDTAVVGGICDNKLVVIFRNAKSRRDAGRMADKAFGRLGRAGGHRAAARAEIPLSVLAEEGVSLEYPDMERFLIHRVRGTRAKVPVTAGDDELVAGSGTAGNR